MEWYRVYLCAARRFRPCILVGWVFYSAITAKDVLASQLMAYVTAVEERIMQRKPHGKVKYVDEISGKYLVNTEKSW